MKKNAMLKIAAILMVAVLLTTCAISSTFAKYVTTSNPGSANARVAKWGVEATVTANNAFYTHYNDGTQDIVVSGATVVAPGTQNTEAITITVKGNPEVDAQIAASGDFLQLTNWNSTEGEYCPLIFNIGDDDYYIGMTDIASVNELQTAVNNAIRSALNVKLEANVEKTVSITIGWTWNFVAPSAEDYPNFTQEDDQDSDLGDTVADTTPNNEPTVAFNATVTVTQIGTNFATNGAAPTTP